MTMMMMEPMGPQLNKGYVARNRHHSASIELFSTSKKDNSI